MPKISAPSVVEHREAQRLALLDAAESLLLDSGVSAVTPRAVCQRVGLARSSFYGYFSSKEDLLVALAGAAMQRWNAEIDLKIRDVPAGRAQLRALVDATMAMTAAGRHEIAGALRDAELQAGQFEDLMALHEAVLHPFVRVVEAMGHQDPKRFAMLAQGVLSAGIELVSHGADHGSVADDVFHLLAHGILPTGASSR